MLEDLYSMPFFLRRHRAGLFGPHVDALAESLVAQGYTAHSIRGVLRGMCAFGEWLAARDHALDDVDDRLVARFAAKVQCSKWTRRSSYHTGPRHVLDFLRSKGVIAAAPPPPPDHEIVLEFSAWMTEHRGVRVSTVDGYLLLVRELLQTLSGDVSQLTARRLRAFVLRRAALHGHMRAGNVVTAMRMFVRFLVASGRCDAALATAVPPVASWRETSVPRHLHADDVERVIAACHVKARAGLRDRAVLLLLARLGLRAGDVASLTLDAFDWKQARLRVAGKARREDWLPLPQDAGDAVLAYLEKARPRICAEAVFFTAMAPFIPISRLVVSAIVGRAIRRARVKSPSHGAHVLRHSAAVRMLRAGSSLTEIGALLRHASIESTFHYAKVDRDLLLAVAAPWPTPPPPPTPVVDSRAIALPWLGVS
jgi:integrase/recombinase XerD